MKNIFGRQFKTKFQLRKMNRADIGAVWEIENRVFKTPWTKETFAQELTENNLAFYLALVNKEANPGGLIGYAGMWIILDEAHVTNLALAPEYHGQGLGRFLLDGLIFLAKTQGAAKMTLEVRPSNTSARRLYEKFDFKECGLRRGYYTDTNEDALILWKDPL